MRRIQPLSIQANFSGWSFRRHPQTAARPSVLWCSIGPSLSFCVFFTSKGSSQNRHVSLVFAIHWSILSFSRLFFLFAVPWFQLFGGLRKNIFCGFGRNIGQNRGGAQRNCPKPSPWRGSPCRCCSRLRFVILRLFRRNHLLATFSSPCTHASSFLLPGCLRARRIERLPLCIEPEPKVSVPSGSFFASTWSRRISRTALSSVCGSFWKPACSLCTWTALFLLAF